MPLMRFHVITIFPDVLREYFNSSILKRAQEKKRISITIHNLRDFSKDRHRKVDDRPYGGGAGMVFAVAPIVRAVRSIKKTGKSKIIITSASGKQLSKKIARRWARLYDNMIIICGHYEGIDERVKKILGAREVSVGPYILTGGELPAMIIIDAVSRHIPGVLGKRESLEEVKGSYPVYTRPEVIRYKKKMFRVPPALISGDHKKIAAWRLARSRNIDNLSIDSS